MTPRDPHLEWRRESPPIEQEAAERLLAVEEGDTVSIAYGEDKWGELSIYHIGDYPGHREIRATLDEAGTGRAFKIYVVREQYVFLWAEFPSGEEPLMMNWVENLEIGNVLKINGEPL